MHSCVKGSQAGYLWPCTLLFLYLAVFGSSYYPGSLAAAYNLHCGMESSSLTKD